MNGHDDHRLVLLSMPIASMVSYTALDLAGRVMESPGRFRVLWLGGGALAIGFVQKPELDGREATQAIRVKKKVSGQRIPIVAITAPVR
jgi:hypothetical protein